MQLNMLSIALPFTLIGAIKCLYDLTKNLHINLKNHYALLGEDPMSIKE